MSLRARISLALFFSVCSLGAQVLKLEPGNAISTTLTVGVPQGWELDTKPGYFVVLNSTCPDASLTGNLRDASGKTIQESASIGGTGGTMILAWATQPGISHMEVRMAGKYPPHCSLRVAVQEYRLLKASDDPESIPILRVQKSILEAQKMIASKQPRQAVPLLEQTLAEARDLHDRRVEGQILYRLGMAHYYLGERDSAIQALRQALAIQRQMEQPYELSLTLNNLGALDQLLGSCHEAATDLNEALQLRETLQDQRGAGYTLLGLANVYYCLGESQESLDADLRSLRIWRELKDEANEAETQNTLGVVYLQIGDFENSRRALNAALSLWRKNKNRLGEGNSTYNLGLLESAVGNSLAALEHQQRALAIFHEIKDQRGAGYALEAIGELYSRRGDHSRALASFEESRGILGQLGERYEEGYLWQALGVEYANQQQFDSARNAYSKALDIEKQVGNNQGQAITWFHLAQLETATSDLGSAKSAVDEAITLVERSRKQVLDPAHRASYLATKREMYALKVSLLIKSGDSASAFEASDAAHARSLLDEISETPDTLATVSDVQSHLDSRTVLIEFLVRNDASYGWAVTATGVYSFPLPPRRQVEAMVRELYDAITARNRRPEGETLSGRANRLREANKTVRVASNRLNGVLFGRMPRAFQKSRTLIVPDGPLYLVPLSLLPALSQCEIAESPSASVFLTKQAEDPRKLMPVLVLADPATRSSTLPHLDFARGDTATLARLVTPPEAKVLEGQDAVSGALKGDSLARFGLIHIAAHATVDMSQPLKSGLVLADGLLTASKISKLTVHARMVTLSACDTAVGKEIEGEGMMSLSRAFLHAGAGSVVSTLWPVDDQATAAFMESFYTSLLLKRTSAARALHMAQIRMQRTSGWEDPFYWAAFVLQGDWE